MLYLIESMFHLSFTEIQFILAQSITIDGVASILLYKIINVRVYDIILYQLARALHYLIKIAALKSLKDTLSRGNNFRGKKIRWFKKNDFILLAKGHVY